MRCWKLRKRMSAPHARETHSHTNNGRLNTKRFSGTALPTRLLLSLMAVPIELPAGFWFLCVFVRSLSSNCIVDSHDVCWSVRADDDNDEYDSNDMSFKRTQHYEVVECIGTDSCASFKDLSGTLKKAQKFLWKYSMKSTRCSQTKCTQTCTTHKNTHRHTHINSIRYGCEYMHKSKGGKYTTRIWARQNYQMKRQAYREIKHVKNWTVWYKAPTQSRISIHEHEYRQTQDDVVMRIQAQRFENHESHTMKEKMFGMRVDGSSGKWCICVSRMENSMFMFIHNVLYALHRHIYSIWRWGATSIVTTSNSASSNHEMADDCVHRHDSCMQTDAR